MSEIIEALSDLTAAEIRGWDKYINRNNRYYNDIIKFLETDTINGYFNRYFSYTEDVERRTMDRVYGVSDRFVYVLKNDETNRVLAFSFVNLMDNSSGGHDMVVQSVAVNPSERGKGYGRKLLAEVITSEGVLAQKNITNIMAMVDADNEASLKMFNSLGEFSFQKVGRFVQAVADFESVKENLSSRVEESEA